MKKDKIYMSYDGKISLCVWMGEVCQTCVKQFGEGIKVVKNARLSCLVVNA